MGGMILYLISFDFALLGDILFLLNKEELLLGMFTAGYFLTGVLRCWKTGSAVSLDIAPKGGMCFLEQKRSPPLFQADNAAHRSLDVCYT